MNQRVFKLDLDDRLRFHPVQFSSIHPPTDTGSLPSLDGPRNLGLAFIALGLLSLVIAVIQDWHYTKRLQTAHHPRPFNLSLLVAGLVALIGVFTFTSVLLRIGPF